MSDNVRYVAQWLNTKEEIDFNDFDYFVDLIAFVDLKYQKDFSKLEEEGMDQNCSFVTVGSFDITPKIRIFIDRLRVGYNGDPLKYEFQTVVAWMPLPKPPKI